MCEYYDYDTGTGSSITPTSRDTSTSETTNWHNIRVSDYIPFPTRTYTTIRRTILVKVPKKWTKKQNLSFTELVNKKTNTGWTVTLIIEGKIVITDPNVERRTMAEFIPLLKNKADNTDMRKIRMFFRENPIKQLTNVYRTENICPGDNSCLYS